MEKGKDWYVLNHIPVIPGVCDIVEIPQEEFLASCIEEVGGIMALLSKKEERYLKKIAPSVRTIRLGASYDETKFLVEQTMLYHDADRENVLLIMKSTGNLEDPYSYYRCVHHCSDGREKVGWSEERHVCAEQNYAAALSLQQNSK